MSRWPTIEEIKLSACSGRNKHLTGISKARQRKYGNQKVEMDGHVFDSKKEARRYVVLRQLQAAGEIIGLQVHQAFKLSVCRYIADFTYTKAGQLIVEDVKGFRTKEYRLKKKLMLRELNIEISEV